MRYFLGHVMRLDMTLLEFLKWNNYKGHSHWMVGSLGKEAHEIGGRFS